VCGDVAAYIGGSLLVCVCMYVALFGCRLQSTVCTLHCSAVDYSLQYVRCIVRL